MATQTGQNWPWAPSVIQMTRQTTNRVIPPPVSWISRRCSWLRRADQRRLLLLRAQGKPGQVGQQRSQLSVRPRGVGLLKALVELLLGQAPGREMIAQLLGCALSLLVGGPEVRHG